MGQILTYPFLLQSRTGIGESRSTLGLQPWIVVGVTGRAIQLAYQQRTSLGLGDFVVASEALKTAHEGGVHPYLWMLLSV